MSAYPTVKVDLGDGDYAEINKYMLRRTQRAITEFCQPFTDEAGRINPAILKEHENELFKIIFINQVEELRIGTMRRYRFLKLLPMRHFKRQGFFPPFDYQQITRTFDEVAFNKMQILEQEMNRLYMPDPLGVKPAGD